MTPHVKPPSGSPHASVLAPRPRLASPRSLPLLGPARSFSSFLRRLPPVRSIVAVPPPTVAPAFATSPARPAPEVPVVHDDRRRRRDDPLDPCSRHAASLAPPVATPAPPEAAGALSAVKTALCIEQLLPDLVRRIAWTGNGRKGTVRLEFGAGALEGATLLVHSDEGRVRVELFAPPGTDVSAWRQRIASRLRGRGIPLDEIDVV